MIHSILKYLKLKTMGRGGCKYIVRSIIRIRIVMRLCYTEKDFYCTPRFKKMFYVSLPLHLLSISSLLFRALSTL